MSIKLYDIECYRNYFCVGIRDFNTEELIFLEISEEMNDVESIYKFFNSFNGYLVSFNGIAYDCKVIKYLLKNYNYLKNKDYLEICSYLKDFSDAVINDDYETIKSVNYFQVNWIDVDLMCYWSKMLRLSKKISLKSLAVQLGYDVIQELPYKPDTILTIENLPKLRYYNYTHDLGILKLLFIHLKDEILLRENIYKETKLNCLSWDAPKIASELLLDSYCKKTFVGNDYEFEDYKKKIKNRTYEFKSFRIGDYLPKFEFKNQQLQDVYLEMCNSNNTYSKEILFKNFNDKIIKLQYSSGGLHIFQENQTFVSNEEFVFVEQDYALI